MLARRKTLTALILGTTLMTGCSHLKEHQAASEEVVQPLQMLEEISNSFEDSGRSSQDYIQYSIETEEGDFPPGSLPKDKITVEIDANVRDAVKYLADSLSFSVIYSIKDDSSLNTKISLNAKDMPIMHFIKMIEMIGDLDIYLSGGSLIISDRITLNGTFSKLEEAGKAGVYENIKKYVEEVLKNSEPATAQANYQERVARPLEAIEGALSTAPPVQQSRAPSYSVVIDDETGTFWISAKPEGVRRSKHLIESLINTAVSHANVSLSIYRVNNQRAKEVGISVNSVVDNLYSLSTGASAEGILNKTLGLNRSVTQANGDVLSTGLSLYEKNGILKTESKTMLTVFNGVATKMSDIQNVGYWVPGNLRENNTVINGASVVSYTEDKPEFTEEAVGKTLVFTPRIDIPNKLINMQVDYSESSVYNTETFVWKRNTGIGDVVEVKKPLKTENKIAATLVLSDNKSTILAGIKSKMGEVQKQFIPGLGEIPILQDIGSNKSLGSSTDTLIVARALFPSDPIIQTVTKMKIAF